jgi:hypothetical protein
MSAGPYRTGIPATLDPPPKDKGTHSVLPLGIIAVTFFLPFTDACSHKAISPMSECHDFLDTWILAPFLAAAMLCVSIVYTLSTKRYARWLTLTAGAISAASILILCGPTVVGGKPGALLLAIPSLVLFFLACKRGPSTQLGRVLDTYVVSSLPLAIFVATAAEHYGAFLFTAAFAVLFSMRAFALARWIRARFGL